MTRELLLLRHGKSDWSVGVDDFYRPLKDRGKRAAQRVGRHSPRGGGGAAGAVRPVLAGGAARLGEVHGDAAGLASPSWVCQEGLRCSEEWHWWREGKRGEGRWGVRKRALRAAHRRRRGAASDWLLTTWERASFATLRASAS